MTKSALEMRSNPEQNSSISLPLAPLFIPKNNFLFLESFFLNLTINKLKKIKHAFKLHLF